MKTFVNPGKYAVKLNLIVGEYNSVVVVGVLVEEKDTFSIEEVNAFGALIFQNGTPTDLYNTPSFESESGVIVRPDDITKLPQLIDEDDLIWGILQTGEIKTHNDFYEGKLTEFLALFEE